MRTLSLVLACVFIGLAVSAATPRWLPHPDLVVVDNHHVSFKIAFKKQNIDVMDKLFWQLSDYNSPMFGKFLNNDQIKDLVSLPEEDIQEVEAYLTKDSGKFCDVIVKRSIHQDYLFVDTCAAQAKVIFPNLNLAIYQKEGTGHLILRNAIQMDIAHNAYLLGFPHQLHQHIAGIHDVTDFPVHQERVGGDFNPERGWNPDDKELTVNFMIEHFGITYDGISDSSYAADSSQVRQAVVEFNNAAFGAQELASFQQKFNVPSDPIQKIVGSEESFGQSGEANLDVQTITSLSGKAQTWDFVFGPTASFNEVIETIMSTQGAPDVYSCSWGGTDEQYTQSSAESVNQDFLKLGVSGKTFMIASGDSGPTLSDTCNSFNPQFPAGSAYVVAVGGTKISQSTNQVGCWEHSSGGFSGLISRPSFQDSAVSHYLSSAQFPPNQNNTVYSTSGRAYPDVAAFGAFEPLYNNGSWGVVGGTSGACPQFAAIITLINIHRYQNNLGPIGSLTKTLYQLPQGVGYDVTIGNTYATNRAGQCGAQYLTGYNAAQGWDATTGLGAPRFQTLLNQLIKVPGEQIAATVAAPQKESNGSFLGN